MSIITLTTDFGTRDCYVAQMKGVILGIAPDATLVDVTHEVPPQDVLAGALVLESLCGSFPPGTIHLAVVDPGVGSARRAVALETEAGIWIGPDNGLFTLVLQRETMKRAVRLTNERFHRRPVSATFHGRDVFAPVAAHLATGVALAELGEALDELVTLNAPEPHADGDMLILHVLAVDHFGNLVTNLREDQLRLWLNDRPAESLHVHVGNTTIRGLARTFADVAPGEPVAYIGSGGRLEVAVRDGDAAERWGRGQVTVRLAQPERGASPEC